LNVGVAAALALTEVLDLLGAGGDLVGDKGSRYFGWYHCGDAAGFTKRGEAFVMKDDLHWDGALLRKVKKKMKKAGLLDASASTFSEARQTRKSCDYTFPSLA
jgi:hypothetical protein